MRAFRELIEAKLLDRNAERVRESHADAIRELRTLPSAQLRVIEGKTLTDGAATPIAHGLGRPPLWVGVSVVRGATATGRIVESRTGVDRAKVVELTATGWGATITIDLAVM